MYTMAKKTAPLLPSTAELLHQFGDRLRLARRRRRLAANQVAERAGMAPMTLRSLERGGSGVTIGAYLAVMQVLGIEKDLDLIGKADPVGRDLQDAQLSARSRTTPPPLLASGKASPSAKPLVQAAATAAEPRPARKTLRNAPASIAEGESVSAEELAGLLDPAPSRKRNGR